MKIRPRPRIAQTTMVLLTLFAFAPAQAQVQQGWLRSFNGGGVDGAVAIGVDATGSAYATGFSLDPSNRGHDFVTIKYSPEGTEVWSRRYDGPDSANDEPSAIAVSPFGDSWITGASQNAAEFTAYVMIRYDPNGNARWTRRLENLGFRTDGPAGLTVNSAGEAYLCGSQDTGSGNRLLVAKYSSNGTELWVRTLGDLNATPIAMTLDGDGNVIVTSQVTGSADAWDILTVKFDSSGNRLWLVRYDGEGNNEQQHPASICVDSGGNICIAGTRSTGFSYQFLILKYSPSGALLWAATSPQPRGGFDASAGAAKMDSSGNVYVTGFITSLVSNQYASDFLTTKYDANGVHIWTARFPWQNTGHYLWYGALALDATGNIYVGAADSMGTLKYSPDGNLRWAASTESGFGRDLAIDSLGNIFRAGQLNKRPPYEAFDYSDLAVLNLRQSSSSYPPNAFVTPGSQEAIAGSNVLFGVTVDGTGPFAYQWRFNGRSIPGAVNSTLVLNPAMAANAGDYSVIVSNATAYTITPDARLLLHHPPQVASRAETNHVLVGEEIQWSAAADGDSPLSYQWQLNGIDIPGATNSTLRLTSLQESATGTYGITVRNAYGVDSRSDYRLYVSEPRIHFTLRGTWPGSLRTNGNGFANAVRVSGSLAYLADGPAGLQIINVSNPAHPVRVGELATGGWAQDIEITGERACVADKFGGLLIVDVSDPAHPALLGTYQSNGISGSPYALQLVGTLAFLIDGEGRLQIIDISDPGHPTLVESAAPASGFYRGLHLSGGRAFLVGMEPSGDDWIGFLNIVDLGGSPIELTSLGFVHTRSDGYGVAVSGQFAFVAGSEVALTIVDTTNPGNPVPAADYQTGGWAEAVQVVGHYAYLAGEYLGLLALDISDPAHPFRAAQVPFGTGEDEGWDLQVVGDHAYVAQNRRGLLVFEINGPSIHSITRVGNALQLRWTGAPGLCLQRTSSLNHPHWTDVPATDGASGIDLPIETAGEFFRLVNASP